MNNYVYVCYEENNNSLAAESGGINELCIWGSDKREIALEWVNDRLQIALFTGYVIDENADIKALFEKESFAITVFQNYQNNWDCSYNIVVEKKLVY